MIDALKARLQQILSKPLPGHQAHLLMSPHVRKMKGVDLTKPADGKTPRDSGVLILLYPGEDGHIYFPLIQRPTYVGAHSGQVSFPGGKVEEEDNSIIDTAKREAWEEVGVDLTAIEVIGQLSKLYIWASNFMVFPVVAFARERPDYKPDVTEVSELLETDVLQILDDDNIKEKEIENALGLQITAPYYDVHGKVVWGATAMMLSELSELLKKTELF